MVRITYFMLLILFTFLCFQSCSDTLFSQIHLQQRLKKWAKTYPTISHPQKQESVKKIRPEEKNKTSRVTNQQQSIEVVSSSPSLHSPALIKTAQNKFANTNSAEIVQEKWTEPESEQTTQQNIYAVYPSKKIPGRYCVLTLSFIDSDSGQVYRLLKDDLFRPHQLLQKGARKKCFNSRV